MKHAVVTAALVGSFALLASCESTSVPERFTGIWVGSPAACGSGEDELILRIDSDRISYWESGGPIEAVVVRGNEIALIAELSGEGESWLATAIYQLSDDGLRLVDDTTVPGASVVRHRCSE